MKRSLLHAALAVAILATIAATFAAHARTGTPKPPPCASNPLLCR